MDGRKQFEPAHLLEAGNGFFLREHETYLSKDPAPGQLVEDVQFNGILDQPLGLFTDGESESLGKSDGPDDPGGIFHETQGMKNPDILVFYIFLPSEKIHQQAELPGIELKGQGIDGEITAKEIHLDG
jgi:hypothetical protein